MKFALAPSVTFTLLLLSFALPGGELRLAVAEKTKLAKVFDGKATFHSTDISLKVDGKDVDSPWAGLVVNLEESSHVEVHDLYGAAKKGKPSKLTRTFDKLEGKSKQHLQIPEGAGEQPPDKDKSRSSELEGKTVVFTLGEDGEYKAAFEDDKGEAALLEKLEQDMDLAGLLPDGAVETDKSFEIDAKALHSVLNLPGGKLKLKTEDEPENDGSLGETLQENAKGKAKGTLKGEREVDGKKYAVVAIEGEIETSGERNDDERKPGAGVTALKVSYTIEGELLWDTESGHFQSCKLTSKVAMTMKNTNSIEAQGEKHELERTTEFEGEVEFTAALGE